MSDYKTALANTDNNEGIYSNSENDSGKETVFGISRKNWPNWSGWKVIDELKLSHSEDLEDAIKADKDLIKLKEDFYKKNYWDVLRCSEIEYQEIANELFDTAVNQSSKRAAKYLQQALNILNRNQKDYSDLKVDGSIGSKTLAALKAYFNTKRFNSRNETLLKEWLLKWLEYYQMKRYEDIVFNNPVQEKWIPGWTDRN